MDVRIESGISGIFPGDCRPMTRIHAGRSERHDRAAAAVLSGVFGSNDMRSDPVVAARPDRGLLIHMQR